MRNMLKVFGLLVLLYLVFPTTSFAVVADVDGSTNGPSADGGTSVKKPIMPANDPVPEDVYTFVDRDTLKDSGGKVQKDLFPNILKAKQTSVAEEVKKLAETDFKSTAVAGDLEIDGGGTMWGKDLNELKNNSSGTTFTVRQGSTAYKIYVPEGSGGRNVAVINNAIASIKKYKNAVQEGILAGTLSESFNVYSMYPSRQVPVADILEKETKDGKDTGRRTFKASAAGVTMSYALESFYNPIFGKMEGKTFQFEDDKMTIQKFWESKIPAVSVTPSSDAKTVSFKLSGDFSGFLAEAKSNESTLSEVKSSSVVKSTGVKTYKTTISKKDYKPKSKVDGAVQLIVPSIYNKIKDGSKYEIDDNKGYKAIEGTKLFLTQYYVYNNGERAGDYASFGIDPNSLVLSKIKVNAEGAYDPKGTMKAAVIPIWFKEAIVASKEGGQASDDDVHWTGRIVKFSNDYSTKMPLDSKNRDLLAAEAKGVGKTGIELRRFGFMEKANPMLISDHAALDTTPSSIKLHINFHDNGDDLKGFYIYRNNHYTTTDTDLLTWLETEEAKAMTDVEATELHNTITGNFEVEQDELTYEEWVRMQEIREELDTSLKSKLMTVIRVLTLLFGVLLIFYSILLVIAYWFDMFNVLVDFRLLMFMTNQNLYPIGDKEEIGFVVNQDGSVRYVTFWNMLVIMLIGIAIGLLFIYCTPIIELLLFAYYKITSWVGVV